MGERRNWGTRLWPQSKVTYFKPEKTRGVGGKMQPDTDPVAHQEAGGVFRFYLLGPCSDLTRLLIVADFCKLAVSYNDTLVLSIVSITFFCFM